MNELKLKGVYKHFKGDYYIVEDIAKDSETCDDVVLYRGLYADGPLYTRTLVSFLSKVDHEKYPEVKQEYKFELQNIESKRKG